MARMGEVSLDSLTEALHRVWPRKKRPDDLTLQKIYSAGVWGVLFFLITGRIPPDTTIARTEVIDFLNREGYKGLRTYAERFGVLPWPAPKS